MEQLTRSPPELHAQALKAAKSEIPGKYPIADTCDFTAAVSATQTTFSFELKD